ncbi:type I secretion system permease/ATPase, partial [Rhizobium mesosinicum]|nr:type I secretion system permease/ATPase [Rhizobium mesosinicum]
MNQISNSKHIFADGSVLDLRANKPSSAEPGAEDFLTQTCISVIDDAVGRLRRLSGKPPSDSQEVAVVAAEEVNGAQAVMPVTQSEPKPAAVAIPFVDPIELKGKSQPIEEMRAPAGPEVEARCTPKDTTELKVNPDIPFAKTIDGDSGPVKENERR